MLRPCLRLRPGCKVLRVQFQFQDETYLRIGSFAVVRNFPERNTTLAVGTLEGIEA
jgi:hypothetical protein